MNETFGYKIDNLFGFVQQFKGGGRRVVDGNALVDKNAIHFEEIGDSRLVVENGEQEMIIEEYPCISKENICRQEKPKLWEKNDPSKGGATRTKKIHQNTVHVYCIVSQCTQRVLMAKNKASDYSIFLWTYLDSCIFGGCHVQNVCDAPLQQLLAILGIRAASNIKPVALPYACAFRRVYQTHLALFFCWCLLITSMG